mmetsp:Transcript_26017/g.32458  ORF Transcript_26017/g.32458 Transcript_26017/m.32458 type:complete len:91 (-) Transcript_26017:960-1232(-)
MTQSITQLFQSSSTNKNMADDGGYTTKPLGGGQDHFGVSHHGGDFGSDFAKVDFDKPLFGAKDSGSGGDGGQPMARSLYSSSSAKQAPSG